MLLATAVLVVGGLASVAILYSNQKHTRNKIHEDVEKIRQAKLPGDTIFSLLQPYLVDMRELSKRGYSSVLNLVQAMIGVQPTCDMALEIWPPAFETYNLIVPNFLNFPHLLLPRALTGAAPRDLVSIAMYVSSRANGCAYCTAHCCSFALRRGVDPEILGEILQEFSQKSASKTADGEARTREAVVKVAYGLGTVPATIKREDAEQLYQSMKSDSDVEWIVAAAAMFGAFNKFMDGLGVPLESATYAETVQVIDAGKVKFGAGKAGSMLPEKNEPAPIPPKDDWTLILACLVEGIRPGGALAVDKKLLGDTPNNKIACQRYLQDRTGASFSLVLDNLHQERLVIAVTAIIAKNMDDSISSGLGISRKVVSGIEFCKVLENPRLAKELEIVASKFPSVPIDHDPLEKNRMVLLLKLTKAVSYSPNRVTPSLVKELRDNMDMITAPMLVEIVAFLAIVQCLHRIESFYHARSVVDQ